MHHVFKTWLLGAVVMQACSPDAAADWRTFAQETLERISAYLESEETTGTEKLATPEEFKAIVPELVREHGVPQILSWGREITKLGDNLEVFTVQISFLNSPGSKRPLVLWIDKTEGSKTTRYADLDSDGVLDGVTFDGKQVLSDATMDSLWLSDPLSASAALNTSGERADSIFRNSGFREMREQANRYQQMYQADYTKIIRLALARYPRE